MIRIKTSIIFASLLFSLNAPNIHADNFDYCYNSEQGLDEECLARKDAATSRYNKERRNNSRYSNSNSRSSSNRSSSSSSSYYYNPNSGNSPHQIPSAAMQPGVIRGMN